MFKACLKSKMFFLHVQSTQTLRMDSPCFFQMSFFSIKCVSFLLKIGKVLTLMIRRTKGLELMNFFYNPFEHIWFKSAFDPENYEFWKYDFNKSYSYICDRGHEYII